MQKVIFSDCRSAIHHDSLLSKYPKKWSPPGNIPFFNISRGVALFGALAESASATLSDKL